MTYDEIKKRLTEVETALQSMQNNRSSKLETSYTAKSISKLTTLKESLEKQLLAEEETMFVSTKGGDTKAVKMDRKTAMDLKKDPNITGIDTAKGAKLKEVDRLDKNSGIEFGQNETAKIAMEVGKSLAIALKKAGDELARMKAKRIEPNSFDIHVTYKGEGDTDEFSFYISDDKLHLVDFSFDKELVSIGTKPSGEAIINKDVLANELLKHFKSLNEEINEVNYDYYTEPKHFDICPGAKALRDELIDGGKSPEELGEWTFKHDELFKLEKAVLKAKKADERHVKVASQLRDEIIHLSRDLGVEAGKIHYLKGHVDIIKDVAAGKEIDEGLFDRIKAKASGAMASIGQKGKNFLSYMKGDKDAIKDPVVAKAFAKVASTAKNLQNQATGVMKDLESLFPKATLDKLPAEAQEAFRQYHATIKTAIEQSANMAQLKEVKEGEGDDHHYIKVPRPEFKAAERLIATNIDGNHVKMDYVDDDGMGNVIIYFMFKDDAIASGEADSFMYDVVMDLQAHGIDIQDHSAELDENVTQKHIDDIEASGNIDIAYKKAIELLKSMIAKNENVEEGHGGDDLDVGHQDDEPGMLKSTSYEIATYAAKLYKKLAKYDQVDGEVDFPNWWQSKLILAKDYVSKAYHYLDSEEKQPIIDKLALEHALSEGTELYDRNGINIKRFSGGKRGLMVQVTYGGEYIQIPADEFPILARAMQSVIGDLRDMSFQYPRSKNVGEALDSDLPKNLSAAKLQKVHGMIVDKMKELNDLRKEKGLDHIYQGGSEPGKHSVKDHLISLTKKKKQVEAALEKAVANIGRGQQLAEVSEDEVYDAIQELRDLIDEIESKGEEAREVVRRVFPNELSRLDAYGAFNNMYSANRYDVTLGGFVDRLEEEGFEIEDGEVYSNEGKYKSDAQRKAIYAAKAEKNEAELSKDEKKKLKDMSKSLKKSTKGHAAQAKYLDKITKEAAPGFKHDCASKVIHKEHGVGICIPEKHTLIKEGNKYVVTHYDVLFKEGKKVVEDIPVEELQIVTQKEHWHKGYKKKKK